MIHAFLLLPLSLASQGGPVHADLHPSDADVYLELGDVSVLLTTLDQAPLLRFVRDERLKSLFTELGQPTDRPLKELVEQGLTLAMPEARPEAWLGGLKTVSLSLVALGPGSETAAPVAVLAVADLATSEQAGALRSMLIENAPKHEPASAALPGVERLQMGERTADDLWCVTVGPRLVLGNSSARVDDYAARAEKKQPGLDSREGLKKQLSALEKASGTSVLWFALTRPLAEILATTKGEGEGGGLEFLDEIPAEMNPFSSPRAARMQLVGKRFITDMVTSEVVAAAKPVESAWLEPVPSGQMLVYASAFDGAAAGKQMRELLAKDEASAATMAAIEQKLGFGPERVLARLGPGMTVYLGPPQGIGLPETRLWIDCADPAAFTADFEALVGALGETLPGFEVKTKPYKVKKAGTEEKLEVPITSLTLPPRMVQLPMISVAPSFAAVGQRLVFGLGSMDVKNELKRAHGGDGEPIAGGAERLKALGFELPAGARSIVVMDWAKLLGGVVGLVQAAAQMAGPEALPFDIKKLPPQLPAMFAEYFEPTFHYAKAIPGGLYRRNEASFGPETWFGLAGVFAAVGASREQTMEIGPPDEAAAPVPQEGGK